MKNAASIIFVTRTMKDDYTNKYDFIKAKSEVLYWGYNEEDFNKVELKNRASDGDLIVHSGNIFDFQNPKNFWKMLKEEIENGRKLRIKFIGTVSPGIKEEIGKNCLMPYTEFVGFLPYDQLLNELSLATYLLVCATEKRHVPGKLFEYMRTGKPIIAFGDDNEEVKSILTESNAGMIFNYNESGKELFEKTPQLRTNLAAVEKFDRKNIAKELANILSKVPGKD